MTTATHTPTAQATRIVLPGIVEPDGLLVQHGPVPSPAAAQVLVRVEATGISFAEQGMRRGKYPFQPKFPFVPGYDLVGTVEAAGPGGDAALIGTRVAVITKTGGWATHVAVDAADLVRVPDGLDPVEAETVVVNGLTAWQMLHRSARVSAGQTVLVHGANGGVGTVLVQLARAAGVRVIGAASPRHHDALRDLGVEPVDYADLDALVTRVRQLAPGGVEAVFDNVGGPTLRRSWGLLAPGGVLVSYAIASATRGRGSMTRHFLAHIARLGAWDLAPNGRRTTFYDVWSGHLLRSTRFRARLREDLGVVLRLLADGVVTAEVAARFPLTDVVEAMRLAESRTVRGKVVLLP